MKNKKTHVLLSFLLLCLAVSTSYGQEIEPGARYTGTYNKSQPIRHVGKKNIVIQGLEISNTSSSCIALYNCENITIKNCKFSSSFTHIAVFMDNCKNITVIDCTFENIQSGVVAHKSQSIKVEFNDFTNVLGRLKGANRAGVMAQFDKVSGTGNSINYNVCENIPDKSSTGDIINLYSSHGTANSPIVIKGNWIRGGGPSKVGGGIILGDMGGSYQIAENNILVNPGQYGVSVAGGNDMTLRNNKVYASRKPFNNVGVYANNFYPSVSKSYNITVEKNEINYTNKNGVLNNTWFGNNMGVIAGIRTNVYNSKLNESILPDQIIGRARTSSPDDGKEDEKEDEKPDSDKDKDKEDDNNNDNDIVFDSDINIYKDTFDRICTKCKGTISFAATITVSKQSGEKVLSIPMMGYHTVIRDNIPPGSYTVTVENGDRLQIKNLTIN